METESGLRSENMDDLQKSKLEKEIKKLEVETNQIRSSWKRQFLSSMLTALLTGVVSFLVIYISYYATDTDTLLDIRREKLELSELKLKERIIKIRKDSVSLIHNADSVSKLLIDKVEELSNARMLLDSTAKSIDDLQLKISVSQEKDKDHLSLIDNLQVELQNEIKLRNKFQAQFRECQKSLEMTKPATRIISNLKLLESLSKDEDFRTTKLGKLKKELGRYIGRGGYKLPKDYIEELLSTVDSKDNLLFYNVYIDAPLESYQEYWGFNLGEKKFNKVKHEIEEALKNTNWIIWVNYEGNNIFTVTAYPNYMLAESKEYIESVLKELGYY